MVPTCRGQAEPLKIDVPLSLGKVREGVGGLEMKRQQELQHQPDADQCWRYGNDPAHAEVMTAAWHSL